MVDEAAHKAAGGLPVVRVAQALIKAPIEDVALCWWQAGRRKVGTVGLLHLCPASAGITLSFLSYWPTAVGDFLADRWLESVLLGEE